MVAFISVHSMNVIKLKTSLVFQSRFKPIITSELLVDHPMLLTKERKEINGLSKTFYTFEKASLARSSRFWQDLQK